MLGIVEGSEPSELSNDNGLSFMSPLASDSIAFAWRWIRSEETYTWPL